VASEESANICKVKSVRTEELEDLVRIYYDQQGQAGVDDATQIWFAHLGVSDSVHAPTPDYQWE